MDGETALYKFITLRKAAGVTLPRISLDYKSLQRLTRLERLRTQVELVESNISPPAEDTVFPDMDPDDEQWSGSI
jgi:hypothetical protein